MAAVTISLEKRVLAESGTWGFLACRPEENQSGSRLEARRKVRGCERALADHRHIEGADKIADTGRCAEELLSRGRNVLVSALRNRVLLDERAGEAIDLMSWRLRASRKPNSF
ncbi:hypothetical protein NDU88_004837 [Pleurodeles waltl]|uniref:Uncharacterized protein n=1 Tax=Pleurodeles waltl TaxID=8319 RepID=A0AAV7PH60_PLEWA|nr:hypothetical protein NDU88_004837 [Pleurodeles waltl]